jgi:hypothetical protein
VTELQEDEMIKTNIITGKKYLYLIFLLNFGRNLELIAIENSLKWIGYEDFTALFL